MQLNTLSRALRNDLELVGKFLISSRWNVETVEKKMEKEKVEKKISRFLQCPLRAQVLSDVHHLRFDTTGWFDRLEGSAQMLE